MKTYTIKDLTQEEFDILYYLLGDGNPTMYKTAFNVFGIADAFDMQPLDVVKKLKAVEEKLNESKNQK